VIERATHRRLGSQLRGAFVCEPQERPVGDVAVGYVEGRPTRNDPFVPGREIASSAWGSGNLLASAGDLARVGDALLRAARRRGMTQWVEAFALMHVRFGTRGSQRRAGRPRRQAAG
jgi:hypothetical protein